MKQRPTETAAPAAEQLSLDLAVVTVTASHGATTVGALPTATPVPPATGAVPNAAPVPTATTASPMPTTVKRRDDAWLQARVEALWEIYYADARRGYPILARFGRAARYRFGSIGARGQQCLLQINALFAHPEVPEYVVDATLAHELAHYAHGYGSGQPKLHAHPHRGGVVDAEMRRRGCEHLEVRAAAWRKAHWPAFYAAHSVEQVARRSAREQGEADAWARYLASRGFRTEEALRQRLRRLTAVFGLEEPPFEVEWLRATARQSGLSYYFERERVARLHGVLADPRVPDDVIVFELSYWLAVSVAGSGWRAVEAAMRRVGVWETAEKGIQWRRKAWKRHLTARHPLRAR